MPPDQDRWRRLSAFDIHAKAYLDHGRQSVDMGDSVAEADIARLWLLAERVALTLRAWRKDIADLDLGRRAPVPPDRAARLISEGFFDEALTPLAYAVFDAALGLAVEGRGL
jgi:hypothetical protein